MTGRRAWLLRGLLAAFLVGAGYTGVSAQAASESRLLREAAAMESRGDFEGAEGVLRRLLGANPSSTGGLFALERVLRSNGTLAGVLPAVDAFLQAEPESSGVRYLKLRVLAEVDSLDALRREAESWLAMDPMAEVPYREVSRVYERALGTDAALDVLRRGRARLGNDATLALEMGDLLAPRDPRAAVEEWGLALGDDGAQTAAVARRIGALGDEGREAASRLVSSLGESLLLPRRRAAAEIALTVGLEDQALSLSREVVGALEGRARASFLTDVARRARESDLPAVAAWAYEELGADASTPAERRQFDQRMVEVSMSAGDFHAALEAQQRLASSFSRGSADRRRAVAEAIRLESREAGPERLRGLLDEFRTEFPDAPELDAMASNVAGILQEQGDAEGAAAVLEGVEGPRSSLERAYLLLDEGAVDEGRAALLVAVGGLAPTVATEIIQFSSLLQRLSRNSALLLARAGVMAHRGRGEEAAAVLVEGLEAADEEERASLLAAAARMADGGGAAAEGAELRRRLLGEFPQAPEGAEAALTLARHVALQDGRDEAIRLLETLIAERPTAAVVPDARRELERLREGAGR